MTFRFIDEHRGQWPVRLLCETLDVSPAGYYAWRDRPASARERRRDTLLVEVRAVHAEVKARYGSPRMHAELAARGRDCCVNTVAQLMRGNGIAAKAARKVRCTTNSNHDLPVADNLLDRQFDPESPTRRGWRTSASSRRARAGCTSRSWRTCTRGGSWAGRWPTTWRAAWPSMPWRWPWSGASRARGCWPIPTAAVSTPAAITDGSWPGMASPAA